MIASVHSHVNSSFVRKQLLKLNKLYHIKVGIWKQRKTYRPRKGNLLHPMFFLTHSHIFIREKVGRDSLKQLEVAFEWMCFINWKKWCNIFPGVGLRALIQQAQGSFHSAGREGVLGIFLPWKNMHSELLGKRELYVSLKKHTWSFRIIAKTLSNVWPWIWRHSKEILLSWHAFCLFSLLCRWCTVLLLVALVLSPPLLLACSCILNLVWVFGPWWVFLWWWWLF